MGRSSAMPEAGARPVDRSAPTAVPPAIRPGLRLETRSEPSGHSAGAPVAPRTFELCFGTDRVVAIVSTGSGTEPPAPGAEPIWSPLPDRLPPEARIPVCVGAGARGCLFFDLAAMPDVLTVTGEPAARTRLGAAIADQVLARPAAAGAPGAAAVVVVGSVLDTVELAGEPLRVERLADLEPERLPGRGTVVLVCAVPDTAQSSALHKLVRQRARRVLPVIVDDVPPARWTLQVTASP